MHSPSAGATTEMMTCFCDPLCYRPVDPIGVRTVFVPPLVSILQAETFKPRTEGRTGTQAGRVQERGSQHGGGAEGGRSAEGRLSLGHGEAGRRVLSSSTSHGGDQLSPSLGPQWTVTLGNTGVTHWSPCSLWLCYCPSSSFYKYMGVPDFVTRVTEMLCRANVS